MKYAYNEKPEFSPNSKGDLSKNRKFIEHFFSNHTHGFKLRSAYDSYKVENGKGNLKDWAENHPDYTTYTEEFVGTLDYILHSEQLKVLELLRIPTQNKDIASHKLPNFRFPSDHLKIAARLEI